MNIPNILTLMRVALIPILVLVYLLPFNGHFWVASGIFALASITDWLDGYLARKWNQSTPFGAFLDPVADKLLVAVALVLLTQDHQHLLMTMSAIVIICREILVSALREWMAEMGSRGTVAVSSIGKWKTAAQMVALLILLSQPPGFTWLVISGYVLLVISAILTLWSMLQYLCAARNHLNGQV